MQAALPPGTSALRGAVMWLPVMRGAGTGGAAECLLPCPRLSSQVVHKHASRSPERPVKTHVVTPYLPVIQHVRIRTSDKFPGDAATADRAPDNWRSVTSPGGVGALSQEFANPPRTGGKLSIYLRLSLKGGGPSLPGLWDVQAGDRRLSGPCFLIRGAG